MGVNQSTLSSLGDPQFASGFSKTEEGLGFFSQDGKSTVSPLVHYRNPHAKASVLGDPYSFRFGNLNPKAPQIPRDPPSIAPLTPKDYNLSTPPSSNTLFSIPPPIMVSP